MNAGPILINNNKPNFWNPNTNSDRDSKLLTELQKTKKNIQGTLTVVIILRKSDIF